ncbi:MAG TPA: iron chelate uptake ABC transporter family permease subunit [Stackebrandtia sp.]|uniref:FecCD family ABC transporter permease n=1 Tax=Stackebrandtia sp. TaxID=2023065 RepID=UPI002D7261CD|nr:iron chelate uptake ABC transporter family permease subunit [Stackebrandtia sp.]HZE39402.1 iron chelate uptake ABC transporter family permease subunit [Stackebrandtia sp.]
MTVLRGASWSLRYRPRVLVVVFALLLTAAACAVVAIGSGDYPMSPPAVVRTLLGGGDPTDAYIVTQLRLPRAACALLAGAALGLSGAVFQSLSRNPLGSPDILGFTEGAATGALLVIVIFTGGGTALALGALTGGLACGGLLLALLWRHGVHGYRLVLTGIGISAILTGVNGYLLTRAQISDAARAVLWLTGSLDGRQWTNAVPLAIGLVAMAPLVLALHRRLSALDLGDEPAAALGVNVRATRVSLLAAAVVLVSVAAAAVGPIAFVALTAPQLARRLTGVSGPHLFSAMCMGAALLAASDVAAQRLQLPVGVITGILGGAYLIGLLVTQGRRGRI